MRILFLGRHLTYFRNFESVVRGLASRGHVLHLAVERSDTLGGEALVEALESDFPNITHGEAPARADDDWSWAASRLRLGLDSLRYEHPLFDDAPVLRSRARERTPGMFVALGDAIRARARWARPIALAATRRLERAVPADAAIERFLDEQRPDLILITPLVDLGSSQIDYLRAARVRRIPTALCVWSWDHLSSKALIRDAPDRVFVWNETQKREAIELHGVPAGRIVVTGAQCFDGWFGRGPSRDRTAFCRRVGLPDDRPFLLYVCSALFSGSPMEAQFVGEWIRRIRASGRPGLANAGILVRPHPSRAAEWAGMDLGAPGPVAVYGGNPVDPASRNDYFDSLYHSAAVVGLNTSAFIEAGIVGRSVHTILLPEFAGNQTGTVHFRYLLTAGGGLLNVAHDFGEHFRQLEEALAAPQAALRPFVREFVRPHGLDVAATPMFVQSVEEMARAPKPAPAGDLLRPAARWVVRRLAAARYSPRWDRWVYAEREIDGVVRLRDLHAVKALREAGRQADRNAARDADRRRREAEKAARAAAKQVDREKRITEKQRLRQAKQARAASSAGRRG